METVFRPYNPSSGQRSDRSAGDRLRHRQKVREAIRGNIADIIAEESIIGKDKNRVIKVPIRGVKEYRFIYGENAPGVGQGGGEEPQPGQVVGEAQDGKQGQQAGDRPGIDYYETDVTLDELIELMFEDLELPDLERKRLRQVEVEKQFRQKGFRRKGIRVRLDKKRTALSRVKRKKASLRRQAVTLQPQRFPFHKDDLRYHHTVAEMRRESNAVVLCIMDTSGSMDTMKKYLARSFFFLLYRFLCSRYQNVEIVFIAHHTEAQEVTEEEFFHKGESGGTFISSGYNKALEIIEQRYHPALWNIYVFHCSDGDNFESDNPAALKAARELARVANLFGYGEIKPLGSGYYGSSMIQFFAEIQEPNFQTVQIQRKEDIWPSFKTFLARDRAREDAA
ncbi:MAG TPA: sporulation protein YhbH [candidate division Zixibacteria bacterium]|nr:sporulation protein YhbH [candidate division Zixibacteria bacterium]